MRRSRLGTFAVTRKEHSRWARRSDITNRDWSLCIMTSGVGWHVSCRIRAEMGGCAINIGCSQVAVVSGRDFSTVSSTDI